ncbi:MAG TPA: hypothetical protein VJZ27_00700, partial [Aggregatilineales bacterium]|nr:hypothetical protein [Aggregatilineales bacterium]
MKQKISVLIFLMSILILLSFVRSSAAQEETPIAAPDDADLPLADVAYVADFATEPDWSGGE